MSCGLQLTPESCGVHDAVQRTLQCQLCCATLTLKQEQCVVSLISSKYATLSLTMTICCVNGCHHQASGGLVYLTNKDDDETLYVLNFMSASVNVFTRKYPNYNCLDISISESS